MGLNIGLGSLVLGLPIADFSVNLGFGGCVSLDSGPDSGPDGLDLGLVSAPHRLMLEEKLTTFWILLKSF